MATHANAGSPLPCQAHDIKTTSGGVSDVTSSDSLGPIIRNALKRQRSETKNPRKPEAPRINQTRSPASDGQGNPR